MIAARNVVDDLLPQVWELLGRLLVGEATRKEEYNPVKWTSCTPAGGEKCRQNGEEEEKKTTVHGVVAMRGMKLSLLNMV